MLIHVLTLPSVAAPGGRWFDYVVECPVCGWLSDQHERAEYAETTCPQCALLKQTEQRRAAIKAKDEADGRTTCRLLTKGEATNG